MTAATSTAATSTAAQHSAKRHSAKRNLAAQIAQTPDTESVRDFSPGPGIVRLGKFFDPARLDTALDEALAVDGWRGELVKAISLTQIPGDADSQRGNNLRGLYWTRPDGTYNEVAREEKVAEEQFSAFVDEYAHTYFHEVWRVLSSIAKIGRTRLLMMAPRKTLSWHRDPEPRLHVPVRTNPGALMIVNGHCTHLPADGSVYFTDTRGYHVALNGGEEERVHLVATLPLDA